MTQEAVVERLIDEKNAVVTVNRVSACGRSCAECGGGCASSGNRVSVSALNPVNAKEGDRVIVESSTAGILRIAALVYLTPFLLFLICYIVGQYLKLDNNVAALTGVGGFIAGFIIVLLYGRRANKSGSVTFRIIEICKKFD